MPTIELDCHGDVNWTLRIRSKLAQLPNKNVKEWLDWSRDHEVGKLELIVASKIAMLSLVTDRVNLELRELERELNERTEDIARCLTDPSPLPLRDPKAIWNLMLDVDSFSLRSRSTYEIVCKFLKAFLQKSSKDKSMSVISETQLRSEMSIGLG
jgi:hypothetical protein